MDYYLLGFFFIILFVVLPVVCRGYAPSGLEEVSDEVEDPRTNDDLFDEYMGNAQYCMDMAKNATWASEARYYNSRAHVWATMAQAVAEKGDDDS